MSERAAMTDPTPLVILPGLLCDSRMFAAQTEALSAHVIDGFYGAANSIGGMASYALERMPPRCALLGHSMGARVALEIMRVAPGRVARLALADTGVHGVRPGEGEARHALLDRGLREGDEALVDTWLPPMIAPARRDEPGLLPTLRAMAVAAGTATYARQVKALLGRSDATPVLPTIACPTFVIVGADDLWAPVEQHRAFAAHIPEAELRIIPDAGHMAPAEAPEDFNRIVREWLDWPA